MPTAVAANRATLEDLMRVRGKAELINGRIVKLMPSGYLPIRVATLIARFLDEFVQRLGQGVVLGDGIGYTVDQLPSGRESFSPDVSYYDGPLPQNLMRFIEGAPNLAVEVRSENDYSQQAELEMAAKRADYFAAGTKAVWDVDPINKLIHLYVDDPHQPRATFQLGDEAHAEPALPGWRVEVARVFGS